MTNYMYRASNLKSTIINIAIRECGGTLYVGLAHTVPPTNTNLRTIFLEDLLV